MAKLGPATPGYGSVNGILLALALSWSLGGFLLVDAGQNFRMKSTSLLYFLLGILIIVTSTAAVAFLADGWLSVNPAFGVALSLSQLMLGGLWSWLIFPIASRKGWFAMIPANAAVGLLGLNAVVAISLLFWPRVTLRF
jgi:hypothetical protein